MARFELMLQSNRVYFFDTTEFEEIAQYYIDSGSLRLAYKALEIGEKQHPDHSGLKLLRVELMLLNNQFTEAEELIDELSDMEPYNEYVYIHKAIPKIRGRRKDPLMFCQAFFRFDPNSCTISFPVTRLIEEINSS